MSETSNHLIFKGTTTAGIVCSDGVVLSSDTRVTMGSFIAHKHGKKIYQIDDHVAMTISGSVADAQRLVDMLTVYARLYKMNFGRPIPVKSAAKLMSNMLFNRRLVPLITQTIVGGIDEEGPSLYSLDILGSLIPDKYSAVGSGAQIAVGVLEEGYNENMTVEEAKGLVTRAVKSAVSRDIMSGDGVDFLIITSEGIREDSIKF